MNNREISINLRHFIWSYKTKPKYHPVSVVCCFFITAFCLSETTLNPQVLSGTLSLSIDLFRLNILFSQYRSCDDAQEIWSFVLFINTRTCKHECLHLLVLMNSTKDQISWVSSSLDLFWENKMYKQKRSIQLRRRELIDPLPANQKSVFTVALYLLGIKVYTL